MKTRARYECMISLKKRQSYFGCGKIETDNKCLDRNGSGKCTKLIVIYSEKDAKRPIA